MGMRSGGRLRRRRKRRRSDNPQRWQPNRTSHMAIRRTHFSPIFVRPSSGAFILGIASYRACTCFPHAEYNLANGTDSEMTLSAKVLSVINMKGGVGKTTVSAHVMRALYYRRQKRVLLVDMDAQFNLTQAILKQIDYDNILVAGSTVIKCFEPLPTNDFFQVKHTDKSPPLASEISHRLRANRKGEIARLDLVPGSFDLMKYSMIDDAIQLKYASNYFKRFISQARQEYDLIVLDCNPSSSFVTKCALDNSTHALSPVRLDRFSILGVGMVNQLFDHLKLTLDHMILVNGVRRSQPLTSIEMDLRAHPKFGPRVLINRLVDTKLLSAEPTYTGFATDRKGPYSGVLKREINAMVDEISNRIGL